jgi:hypothetical protein
MSRPLPPLEERFWARIEKTDTCWNWTGPMTNNGYGYVWHERKTQTAHRLSYQLLVGPIEDGMVLDHLCHHRACVNPEHLRQVTHKENLENLTGAYSVNNSGIRGVTWHKAHKKWQAGLRHNGRSIHVGYFDDISEAEAAVTAKRNELFTHNDLDRRAS